MLNFNTNQCVQVNNEQEFNKIYLYLKSYKQGVSLEEWINDIVVTCREGKERKELD